MTTPLVSVIIPVYNRSDRVSEAIASACRQTHSHLEIIVVDDGSTDDAGGVIRNLADSDHRIHYFHQTNQGPAAARNKGITSSTGEFIAFLDSDDLWIPRKTAIQLKAFDKDSVAFVYCAGSIENSTGKRDEEWTQAWQPDGRCRPEDILFRHPRFLTPGVMLRRSCLAKTGVFDVQLRYYEDVDLWFRILLFFEARFIGEELVTVRRDLPSLQEAQNKLPAIELLECLCLMREKAVSLYEQQVRNMSASEKKKALHDFRIQLLKELLAAGRWEDARNLIATKQDIPRGWFFYLLTLLPSGIVPFLIKQRRKILVKS